MPASSQTKSCISVCQNHGFCTADCPLRPVCTKSRTPLLIPAIVVHYRTGKIYADDYINELAQLKQELIDGVVHGSELKNRLKYFMNLDIKAI